MPPVFGKAFQDYFPRLDCFGCGPANRQGLQIKSYWSLDQHETVCFFDPAEHHSSGIPDVLHGGILASVIDCHAIWTAIADAYKREGRPMGGEPMIGYVTGDLHVRFKKRTPLNDLVLVTARVARVDGRKTYLTCEAHSGEEIRAEGSVIAIRIDPSPYRR